MKRKNTMNKTILAMILSAICSSGWWSGAMFNNEGCTFAAQVLSMVMLGWVAYETLLTIDL